MVALLTNETTSTSKNLLLVIILYIMLIIISKAAIEQSPKKCGKRKNRSWLYLPGDSIRLASWLQLAIACFGWEFNPKSAVLELLLESGRGPHTLSSSRHSLTLQNPNLTQCVTDAQKCTRQMASESIKWFKYQAQTWQTDRPCYEEMWRNTLHRLYFKIDIT